MKSASSSLEMRCRLNHHHSCVQDSGLLGKVIKIILKHTVNVNEVPWHVRVVRKCRHDSTVNADRRLLRAVGHDPSVQGDERPGMLEMLDELVENLPLRTGALVRCPSRSMVLFSSRKADPMLVSVCQLRAREAMQ